MRSQIVSSCASCGNSMSFAGKPKKYCSTACYRDAQKSGAYRGLRCAIYACQKCGKEFSRSAGSSGKDFCSRQCYDDHRRSVCVAKYSNACAHCGVSYTRSYYPTSAGKYCSHACRVADKKPQARHCVQCNCLFSPVYFSASRGAIAVHERRTCSAACLQLFYQTNASRKDKISHAMSGAKHPLWDGGSHQGASRGPGWAKLAESIRERDGRACRRCGMTEAESKSKGWGRLQVNHIKPFHQFQHKRMANKPSNLEALCKRCHRITDAEWKRLNPVQLSLNIWD